MTRKKTKTFPTTDASLFALLLALLIAVAVPWPALAQFDRLKKAAADVRGVVDGEDAAAAELSRKQRYELDQIGVTLNNAEGRLEAWQRADREDLARMARRGAERRRDEAAEELATYRSNYPEVAGHPDVAAVDERIAALDRALAGQAQAAQAASTAAATAGASAQADAERILALYSEYGDVIDSIHGNSLVYYGNPDDAREGLEKIEAAETAAEQIRPFMKTVAERYGRERGQITEAMDAAGVSVDQPNYMVDSNAHNLFGFLEKLQSTRTASVESVVDAIRERLDDLDDFAANIQQQRLAEALELADIGRQIDPNHPDLGSLRLAAEQAAGDRQAEQMARIDAADWPGHSSDFSGPGSIDELAANIQQYLANDRDWGQRKDKLQEVLGVAVRGPWQVAKRDILGQPVQWRLPVLVAITDAELRPDGIARAYELSMVAMEGAANDAPKSPPWDGFWVGDNYFLKADRLP